MGIGGGYGIEVPEGVVVSSGCSGGSFPIKEAGGIVLRITSPA